MELTLGEEAVARRLALDELVADERRPRCEALAEFDAEAVEPFAEPFELTAAVYSILDGQSSSVQRDEQ